MIFLVFFFLSYLIVDDFEFKEFGVVVYLLLLLGVGVGLRVMVGCCGWVFKGVVVFILFFFLIGDFIFDS